MHLITEYLIEPICQSIIRPYREYYTVDDLGLKQFSIEKQPVRRWDFQVLNDKQEALECSFYERVGEPVLPVVILLHGNASSRLNASRLVSFVLPLGVNLVTFDFSGAGISGGKYITLGYQERNDLAAVVNHLRRVRQVKQILLWGRSMGAATALFYA
jgi:alpha-beta hydrolase superfamily lysophospholipase